MTRAMRCHVLSYMVVAGLFAASASRIGLAQSSDPFIGKWTLNPAKSTYSPGPAPKSGTATFTAPGDNVQVVIDGVAADGKKTHWEYTAKADGKEYPVMGNPEVDTIRLQQLNSRSVATVYKMGGKATITNVRTVSADGKKLTVTSKGTNLQGQTVNNVQVFDKK